MNYAKRMQVGYSFENLIQNLTGFFLWYAEISGAQVVKEVPTVIVLKHYVNRFLRLEEFNKLHNIWVVAQLENVQFLSDLNLVLQGQLLLGYYFNRNFLLG